MGPKYVMYPTCMFPLMRLMVHGFLNADVRAPVVEKMASGGSTTFQAGYHVDDVYVCFLVAEGLIPALDDGYASAYIKANKKAK